MNGWVGIVRREGREEVECIYALKIDKYFFYTGRERGTECVFVLQYSLSKCMI